VNLKPGQIIRSDGPEAAMFTAPTTGHPLGCNSPFPNPSGLRVAVEVQGSTDQWLLIPIEMLPLIVENSMRFRRQYVSRPGGSGYEYELKPEPSKSINERAREGFLALSPQLYETATLVALQTAARMEEAAATAAQE